MAGKNKDPLVVREHDDAISIWEGYSQRFHLSAAAARHLARKLNRLALRIERRNREPSA